MSSIWKETRLEGGIHGLAAGSGTTVVLSSGWPETAEAYSGIIPQLADNHQVLALDPPGLGDQILLWGATTRQTSRTSS